VSTVSALANFFAEKTMAGLGDWKVQLDPRGLMDLCTMCSDSTSRNRNIELAVPSVDEQDKNRNILFLVAKF